MLPVQDVSLSRTSKFTMLALLCVSLPFLLTPLAQPQDHDMDGMPGMAMHGAAAREDPGRRDG